MPGHTGWNILATAIDGCNLPNPYAILRWPFAVGDQARVPSFWLMKPALFVIIVVVLCFLHQDFWFWRTAHPLLFGFIPIGLSYHAGFAILTSLVLWLLVSQYWPAHLEHEIETTQGEEEDQAS